ncbi:helix-turn-helix domain-containing protein [Rhodobacteraceae bacterium CCMM004]|nr:helix-turn-helix domain-containing protein [Rhodobacteraceae bacterium CCMM004]
MAMILDKRDRSQQFRTRLSQALTDRGMSQSALARACRVDRSTLSQLLSGATPRMPGAQLLGDMAAVLGVSADWLLSLSDRPESAADLLAASLSIDAAPRALVDERIFGWHREAAGYKIRHVPANLPDMLKTDEMMRWEYAPHLGKTTEQAIGASRDRLDWMRSSSSDYEIAMPLYELDSFVRGEGYYRGLPRDVREGQIARLLSLHDTLFPRLRLFLFDARQVFAAPITVFGPLMAVLYSGQHYLTFRDSERVAAFARDFDRLVRNAWVSDRDFPGHLTRLGAELRA